MKNIYVSKYKKKKTGAIVFTLITLFSYLAFLFIPANTASYLPFTGKGSCIPRSLLEQIVYICQDFLATFQAKNLTMLHYATLALISFMVFVLISSLLALLYRRRAIYTVNIIHAVLAIVVVIFYVIALMHAHVITNLKELFIYDGKFTFAFPSYLPLIAVVFAIIALIARAINR